MSTYTVSYTANRFRGYFKNDRLVTSIKQHIDFGTSGQVILSVQKGFGSSAYAVIKASPGTLRTIQGTLTPIIMSEQGFIPKVKNAIDEWSIVTWGPDPHDESDYRDKATGGGLVKSKDITTERIRLTTYTWYKRNGNQEIYAQTKVDNEKIPDPLVITDFIDEGYLVLRLKTEPVEFPLLGSQYTVKTTLFKGYPGVSFRASGIKIEEIFFLQ